MARKLSVGDQRCHWELPRSQHAAGHLPLGKQPCRPDMSRLGPRTAPPAAKQSALLVANKEVAAGQVAPLKYWLANPSVMLGIAAIAIVVPIVVFNISQDRQASP